MADEGKNLQIQQQINQVLSDRAAMLDSQAQQISSQVSLAMELCDALQCQNLDGMADRLSSIQEGMTSAAESAAELRDNTTQMGNAAKQSGGVFDKVLKNINAKTGAAAGAIVGIPTALKGAQAQVEALGSAFSSAAGSAMRIGSALLAMPFTALKGLIGMANAGGGGVSALKTQMEELRKEFGSLATGEGAAFNSALTDLRANAQDFAGTGLSLRKLYGGGKAGLAAALKDLQGIAGELGNAFGLMSDEFAKSAPEILAFKKGLGLADDAMAAIAKRAKFSGKSVTSELSSIANLSIQMGEKFGVNAKKMSRDMGKMVKDFSNFGSLSQKEMAATAAYAQKLGMEIDDMMGVIDKFDNFEDAAQGASMLAQSFGMNVDAMEMMNAQSPAERIDILRKSFHETGKSIEDMTRQERKLLEEQTGLTGAALDAAFSQENMGTSYEDLQAGAADAEENSMSQEEALGKLADSMERVFGGGGGGGFTGFWDAFSKGFMSGIASTEEFRAVMKNLKKSMKVVFRFGKDLGKMFVELFPGIKDIFGGLTDLFNPEKFKELAGELLGIFKDLFTDLATDPKAGAEKFIDRLGKAFSKFFGKNGDALKKIKEGFSKAIGAIAEIIKAAVPKILEGLKNMLNNMADSIRNPPGDMGKKGLLSTLLEMISSVADSLISAAPAILGAILNLLSAVFEKHGGTIMKVGAAMVGFIFIKMLIAGAATALKGAIMGKIVGMFSKAFGSAQQDVSKEMDSQGPPGGEKGSFIDGLKSFVKSINELEAGQIVEAGLKLALVALSFLPTLAIMAAAIVMVTMIISTVSFGALIKGLIGLTAAIISLKVMMKVSEEINAGGIGKSIVGMLGAAALLTVGGYALGLALALVTPVLASIPLGAAIKGMVALGLAAIAALGMAQAGAIIGAMGPAGFGIALIGLIGAAVLLTVGAYAMAIALTLAVPALKKVDWGSAIVGMAGLALVMLTTVIAAVAAIAAGALGLIAAVAMLGVAAFVLSLAFVGLPALALASSAMSALDWGSLTMGFLSMVPIFGAIFLAALVAIPAGIAGLLGAVALLGVAAFIYSFNTTVGPQLPKLAESFAAVDMKKLATDMMYFGLAMIPLTLAAVLAIPAGIAGLIGGALLGGVAYFLDSLGEDVLPPLSNFMKKASSIDFNRLILVMGALVLMFVSMVVMAAAAIPMAIFGSFLLRGVIESGFETVGEMAESMVGYLAPAIKKLNAIKVDDPAMLEAKINALVAIFDAVGGMADIVFKIALLDVLASAGGGESGAILEGAAGFMDSMLGGATKLIRALAQIVSTMPEGDIKKLEAIGGVLSAIANLMTALQPPPGLFETMTEMGSGGFFGGGQDVDVEGIMSAYADTMDSIMASMMDMITPMVEEMMNIDLGPDPEAAKMKAETIAAALNAVVGMATGFGEMASGVMEMNSEQQGFFGSGPSVVETMNSYMAVLDMIMGVVSAKIPQIVQAVMSAAESVGDPETAKPKLEVVSLAMSALSDFASAINAMSGQIPEPGWFESSEDVLDEFMDTVNMIVGVAIRYIPTIVSRLLSIRIPNPEEAAAKMDVIAKAMQTVSNFTSTLDNFSGMGAADIYNTYGPIIKGIAWLFGYQSDGSGQTIPELMNTMANMEIGDAGSITSKLEGINEALGPMNTFINSFATLADGLNNISTEALANAGSNFQLVIDEMVSIHEILNEGLPNVNLVGALEQFGENMSISSESISVENKPININVSFNVSMNARNIASALSDATIAGNAALLTASEGAGGGG